MQASKRRIGNKRINNDSSQESKEANSIRKSDEVKQERRATDDATGTAAKERGGKRRSLGSMYQTESVMYPLDKGANRVGRVSRMGGVAAGRRRLLLMAHLRIKQYDRHYL